VTRKAVQETQGAFLTGLEAREFATAGRVAIPPPDMPCVTTAGPVTSYPAIAGPASPDLPVVSRTRPFVPGPPGAVTLREAADAGLFPSLVAARKASTRPGFPDPVGARDLANLYDLGDLQTLRERRISR